MSKKLLLVLFIFLLFALTSLGISFFLLRDPISKSFGGFASIFQPKQSENLNVSNVTINEDNFVVEVIENYGDAVVSINYVDDVFSDYSEAIGSGVVISEDGLIVTNKHVVEDEDIGYEIILQNGDRYPVKKIIRDKVNDLALLEIDASGLVTANIATSDEDLKLGQKVIAVGNALGFSNSVSLGIISGLKREIELDGKVVKNLIQTDAAINMGNSGGALFNSMGDLIGINTARTDYADNIGFAIPSYQVIELVDKYTKGEIDENSEPAFLGISYELREIKSYVSRGLPIGPVVTGIVANSPASIAGVRVGDIIVSIDDKEFNDESELSNNISSKNPGDKVKIKVYRINRTINLEANLVSRKNLLR